MKNYIIKQLDILDKVADVYIDDYLVGSYPYKQDHPYWAVFDQIKNGSTPIHIKEYNKVPSIGMEYENNIFVDGKNGETFVDVNDEALALALIDGSTEAIVTVSSSNKVDGSLIVFMKYKNWVNENFAALFSALTSNPIIVIKDNINNKFDFLNNLELLGTTRPVPELSDIKTFYSQWEGK
jgi:hypothetical protein